MNGITAAALLLLLIGALLTRIGERLVDWLIPDRLNHRLAAALARVALRLAGSGGARDEAADALGSVLAEAPESREISPLAAVAPVLFRCALSRLPRLRLRRADAFPGYRYTNSKGVTYYLNSKPVTLRGGKTETIYYFSKHAHRDTACQLPVDRTVHENPTTGFVGINSKDLPRPAKADGQLPAAAATSIRSALRAAIAFPIREEWIAWCVDLRDERDQLFARALESGLHSLEPRERHGHLPATIGFVAESVAAIVLDDLGYRLLWQLTTPGVQGVDLLLLSPDERVLALEIKGTLRQGAIPRLTPSAQRQMSRDWLNRPNNPAMADLGLEADDLFSGLMVVDLASRAFRLVLSADFENYRPVADLSELQQLRALG
jgi:hypothetical protein